MPNQNKPSMGGQMSYSLLRCPFCGTIGSLKVHGLQGNKRNYECKVCKKHSVLPKGIRISNKTTSKPLIDLIRNKGYLELLDIYHYFQENHLPFDDVVATRKTLKTIYHFSKHKCLDLAIYFYYLTEKRPEGLDLAIIRLENKSLEIKKKRKER